MFHFIPLLLFLSPFSHCLPARESLWHGRPDRNPDAVLTAACGEATSVREYPWTAILFYDNQFACGATLLKADLAITAAHCVIGQRTDFFLLHYGRTFQPDTGKEDRGAFKFGGHTRIEAIRIHPNYDVVRKYEGFDIALLRLEKRITFNELVKPISVVPLSQKYIMMLERGADVKMAGFGQISGPVHGAVNRDYPDQMQLVDHRIVPHQQCNRGNDTNVIGPPRDVLCTRGKCGRDQGSNIQSTFKQLCPGDSGSGIVGFFQEENKYYLLGVVSYIISPNKEDCGKSNKPAFSINARDHRDFIYEDFNWEDLEPTPVNCTWRRWSQWTACSQSCGGGTRSRRRSIYRSASDGGAECTGSDSQEINCNTLSCNKGPSVSFSLTTPSTHEYPASIIPQTDKSCPPGISCQTKETCSYIQQKYQNMKYLETEERGAIVSELKSAICNKKEKAFCCLKPESPVLVIPQTDKSCPPGISCETRETCSYIQEKYENVKDLEAEERGAIINELKSAICNKKEKAFCCPKAGGEASLGLKIFTLNRDPNPPEKINTDWNPWSEWTECSRPCGGGAQTRTRQCARSNVYDCPGGTVAESEDKNCNSRKCPQSGNSDPFICETSPIPTRRPSTTTSLPKPHIPGKPRIRIRNKVQFSFTKRICKRQRK